MSYLSHQSEQRAAAIHLGVLRLLEVERLFRDASITARRVAEMLNETPQSLSSAVAKRTGSNFSVLLAKLRTDEACRLLSSAKHQALTLEEVGLLSGFASRQNFYATFQKHMGMTPRQYRQQVLCKTQN